MTTSKIPLITFGVRYQSSGLKRSRQCVCVYYSGGNRTMVAAAAIVSMAAAKKAQQNVFALYHSYNHTILLGFIWILDFHFKIVPVLRRRYLIPIRCNNGKRKMWPWRWMHHFDFQHWRWLQALMTMVALFRAGNFWHRHSWSPADKCAYGLYDCCVIRVRTPALTPISTV